MKEEANKHKGKIFKEVFDEHSEPSESEVLEYAAKIGIEPKTEQHLLPLAREGILSSLPEEWKPCFDETLGEWYYFNFQTGVTQWNHPLDQLYKQKVHEARKGNGSDLSKNDDIGNDDLNNDDTKQSNTLTNDDIKQKTDLTNDDTSLGSQLNINTQGTEEDTSKNISFQSSMDIKPKKLAPLAPLGGNLAPIGLKKSLPPLKKLSSLGPLEKPKVPSLAPISKEVIEKPAINDNRPLEAVKGDNNAKVSLSLSGKGTSFLKKSFSDENEKEETSQGEVPEKITVVNNKDTDKNPVKSILKLQSPTRSKEKVEERDLDKTLRNAMIQKEEKRIMFNLDANIEFVTESEEDETESASSDKLAALMDPLTLIYQQQNDDTDHQNDDKYQQEDDAYQHKDDFQEVNNDKQERREDTQQHENVHQPIGDLKRQNNDLQRNRTELNENVLQEKSSSAVYLKSDIKHEDDTKSDEDEEQETDRQHQNMYSFGNEEDPSEESVSDDVNKEPVKLVKGSIGTEEVRKRIIDVQNKSDSDSVIEEKSNSYSTEDITESEHLGEIYIGTKLPKKSIRSGNYQMKNIENSAIGYELNDESELEISYGSASNASNTHNKSDNDNTPQTETSFKPHKSKSMFSKKNIAKGTKFDVDSDISTSQSQNHNEYLKSVNISTSSLDAMKKTRNEMTKKYNSRRNNVEKDPPGSIFREFKENFLSEELTDPSHIENVLENKVQEELPKVKKSAMENEPKQKYEKNTKENELKQKYETEAKENELKKKYEREAKEKELKQKYDREAKENELKQKYEREAKENELKQKYEREAKENELKQKYDREAKENELKLKYEREAKESEQKLKYEIEAKESELKQKYEKDITDLKKQLEYKNKEENLLKQKYEEEIRNLQEKLKSDLENEEKNILTELNSHKDSVKNNVSQTVIDIKRDHVYEFDKIKEDILQDVQAEKSKIENQLRQEMIKEINSFKEEMLHAKQEDFKDLRVKLLDETSTIRNAFLDDRKQVLEEDKFQSTMQQQIDHMKIKLKEDFSKDVGILENEIDDLRKRLDGDYEDVRGSSDDILGISEDSGMDYWSTIPRQGVKIRRTMSKPTLNMESQVDSVYDSSVLEFKSSLQNLHKRVDCLEQHLVGLTCPPNIRSSGFSIHRYKPDFGGYGMALNPLGQSSFNLNSKFVPPVPSIPPSYGPSWDIDQQLLRTKKWLKQRTHLTNI